MAGQWEVWEDLTRYPMDEAKRERMLEEQLECCVGWTTRDGWPLGVMHWFVWARGRFWVTSTPARKRVPALRARPKSFVTVSGVGTSIGRGGQTVTAKTTAAVHDDRKTKDWFFPALTAKAYGRNETMESMFREMLFNTERVVIELEPVKWISYDAMKMYEAIREG